MTVGLGGQPVSVRAELDARGIDTGHRASALEPSPERLHVVGHSFGGQIAIDFALLAPQRVQALTLICTRDTPFPAFAAAAARLSAVVS